MKHSPQARVLVSTLAAAITMAIAWSIMHAPTRTPASTEATSSHSKETLRSQSETSLAKSSVHKPSANLSVTIDQIEQTFPTIGLRGQIRAERPMSGYQFVWIVSDGDKIVEGTAAGSVPTMNAGDTFDIRLQVTPAPGSNNPVVLHVYQLVNGEPRGVIAQWNVPSGESSERDRTSKGDHSAQLPDGLVQ